MKHTTINVLLKAENIMGIYRNYSSQTDHRKTQIIRVILEILISAGALINCVYETILELHSGHNIVYRKVMFNFANYFFLCTTMVCAIQSSRSYNIFLRDLIAVYHYLNTESIKKCSRRLKNFFITTTVALCIGAACLVPLRLCHRSLVLGIPPTPGSVIICTSEIFSELRFSIEHVIFYIYISG